MSFAAAGAQEGPSAAPKLGIQPADQPGSWYDLGLEPGAIEHLSVELANHGVGPLVVASYAADVYRFVGGSMGVALRDETTSGTTQWLEYSSDMELLRPDEAVRRTVTLTIPDDVEPGQYLAALVIENDQPLPADGELGVEYVVRQAIAVNITLPGPAAPALSIGDVEHIAAGQRSVARLEIDNTGNRHLKPAGSLTLTNEAGDLRASHDVTMDSVYAGTTGHLEIGVDELLPPGIYTVAADLRDDEHAVAATGSAQFEIVAPPVADRVGSGVDRVRDSIAATGLPVWMFLTAVGLILALLLSLILGLAGRRRRGRPEDTIADPLTPTPPTPPTAAPAAPPPSVPAPPTSAPTLGTRERRSMRRTSPRRAVPEPSQIPTRTAQQPVAADAQTATVHAVKDPPSTVLFTARPPRRRRCGSR